MPQKSAKGRTGGARAVVGGIVLRGIKDGVAVSLIIRPRREVGHAKAEFQRQFRVDLPGILNKAFIGVVRNIIDAVKVLLGITRQIASQHVRIRIAVAESSIVGRHKLHISVCEIVRWLRVSNPLVEKTCFESMRAPYLCQRVTDTGHVFIGI